MCKTVVYRVENEGGYGPYGHDENTEFAIQLARRHQSPDTHPALGLDFSNSMLLAYGKKCVCGCTSMEKLAEWFDGFGEKLRGHGFRVVAYEVDHYWAGKSGKQVIFIKPPGAKPLATWLCDYVI